MALTHEFYLAPYSEFSHEDDVCRHSDRLEAVGITDQDFDELSPELSRVPTLKGLWREGSSVIEPAGAAVAVDLFDTAAKRVTVPRLQLLCRRLANFSRRAASGKYFIYHSGL
jgi:hypothetical protein